MPAERAKRRAAGGGGEHVTCVLDDAVPAGPRARELPEGSVVVLDRPGDLAGVVAHGRDGAEVAVCLFAATG